MAEELKASSLPENVAFLLPLERTIMVGTHCAAVSAAVGYGPCRTI
jgi:hypothetical protein